MRLIFMGTPDFSVPALRALVGVGHEIAAVYCQPPRPAGRGKKARPSAVQATAKALGLEVRHPVNFKSETDIADFEALGADVAVVVAYGLILPQSLLDAPARGCLNIHASLLPRWRGAAPIHRAIMAGDTKTGVSIMQMDRGLDTGDVLDMRSTSILGDDTTGRLHDRLAHLGAEAIVQAIAHLDRLTPTPQAEAGASYAAKIDKAEARIDWARSGRDIDLHIRGLSPFPGAWCTLDGVRLKVLESRVEAIGGPAGIALDDRLAIGCARGGAVRLLKVQRPGKAAMAAEDFLRGNPVPKGTELA
ncbi:MAG: methionyl-tRNA formyltransferase [Paracoccaceae bacterium]